MNIKRKLICVAASIALAVGLSVHLKHRAHAKFCEALAADQYQKRQAEISRLWNGCSDYPPSCIPITSRAEMFLRETDREILVKQHCIKDTQ